MNGVRIEFNTKLGHRGLQANRAFKFMITGLIFDMFNTSNSKTPPASTLAIVQVSELIKAIVSIGRVIEAIIMVLGFQSSLGTRQDTDTMIMTNANTK